MYIREVDIFGNDAPISLVLNNKPISPLEW